MEHYSEIAVPVTNLTWKASAWNWTSRCQYAFELLKQKLVEAPLLCTPCERLPYEVATDASDLSLGAVLLEEGHPVAFEEVEFGRVELQRYGERNACSCARTPCVAVLSGRCRLYSVY
jgi:hypothetical protein